MPDENNASSNVIYCWYTLESVDFAAFLASSSFFQAGISGSFGLDDVLEWDLFTVTVEAVVPALFRSNSFCFHSGTEEELDRESLMGPVGPVGVGERECERLWER